MENTSQHDYQKPAYTGGIPSRHKNHPSAKLLIVEDDPDISSLLVYTLQTAHFLTTEAADCERARQILTDSRPDLVLLDWGLPDVSGLELLRQMRQDTGLRDIPVIMLTARGEAADRVRGLESGADDYIVKPFSPRELCARINNHVRIPGTRPSSIPDICGVLLYPQDYRICVNETCIELGPTLFRLLWQLMNNRERLLTRRQLLNSVWGSSVYIEEHTLDAHIQRLRRILAPFHKAELIQTVSGAGYRFSEHNRLVTGEISG
jgi:two-component system phosphate regulon response regulator PhoB